MQIFFFVATFCHSQFVSVSSSLSKHCGVERRGRIRLPRRGGDGRGDEACGDSGGGERWESGVTANRLKGFTSSGLLLTSKPFKPDNVCFSTFEA